MEFVYSSVYDFYNGACLLTFFGGGRIVRDRWKTRWIEAVLAQMGDRSPEQAAEEFQASYSTLRRWTLGEFKKEPGTRYRERLAELRGQSFEQFEAWLNGASHTPAQGKTWAELGREVVSDPVAGQELISSLDPVQLGQLLQVVLKRQNELLGDNRR